MVRYFSNRIICQLEFISENHYLVTIMNLRKKSQGSEFDRVLLIMPEYLSAALSRELLYTAVTRARRSIEIWGTEEVFRHTVERRTVRNSGLKETLSGGTA